MNRFLQGFVFAGRGLVAAWRGELNLKVMLVLAVMAVALGWYRDLDAFQWALIVFCIGLVLSLEIMNTAIERLVDVLSPDHDPRCGKIKDIAAGAVLVASVAAGVVGVVVLWP